MRLSKVAFGFSRTVAPAKFAPFKAEVWMEFSLEPGDFSEYGGQAETLQALSDIVAKELEKQLVEKIKKFYPEQRGGENA